jgi:hypothetical protein
LASSRVRTHDYLLPLLRHGEKLVVGDCRIMTIE